MKKYVIHGVTWAGEDIPLVAYENEIEADTALSQFETDIFSTDREIAFYRLENEEIGQTGEGGAS